ncbi:PulJ/GspJ family protein [Aeoliella sp.]|uniref:PulJ/GspJ family protein n=1 Tax=Aeoliella sp. TaxID=2795800 RepID=UPI003CCB89E5
MLTRRARHSGFTLIEMLVAISITLVMMATVVGVFATVSSSVSKRRAAVEVGNQLRHVRNVLQRDLEGMTCPGIPWQRPESDVGYFEIVEGLHADFFPSALTDDAADLPLAFEIDHVASTVPSSNLEFTRANPDWVTDGGGLGDHDDILAFTSRNEQDPFTGPAPSGNVDPSNNSPNAFENWGSQTITSPVAEVIWYCVENPADTNTADSVDPRDYFGEPGMRAIYRRTLLVAPWLDYRFNVDATGAKSRPGVLRIMSTLNDPVDDEVQALAALIAFQERYDISARIQFDPTIGNQGGAWTIVANTLADLTDRKNRYEHHGYVFDASRAFGYRMVSAGGDATSNVRFVVDPEYGNPAAGGAGARPYAIANGAANAVGGYELTAPGTGNFVRPLAILEGGATARAIVDENGQIVHVTTGLAPLGVVGPNQSRRGADLMISDALAFDVQVFDPDAPVYALLPDGTPVLNGSIPAANADITAVTPGDIGWTQAFTIADPFVVSNGAYVDLGYGDLHREFLRRNSTSLGVSPGFTFAGSRFGGMPHPKSQLGDLGFTRTYDTWNFAYEHDGVNQDGDVDSVGNPIIDEGTNNLDDRDPSLAGDPNVVDHAEDYALFGPDDMGERETSPPYPVPLRGVQVKLRVYEPDSRQIREVTVRQHLVPE